MSALVFSEDIKKDRADAKSDEDASQSEFDDFKKDSPARLGICIAIQPKKKQ